MKNKKIALAVSAGIAAYKAIELLRMMVKEGSEVRVTMSANAGEFVTPLTFETLSGNPVYHELFNSENLESPDETKTDEVNSSEEEELEIPAFLRRQKN